MTHTLSYNMYSTNLVKKLSYFYKPEYNFFWNKKLSEMFTEPNDPINTVQNYVPTASFNITVSAPKRHFFCRFRTEFLTLFWMLPFMYASSILFFFYQITNISRRVLTVTFFILCFHNYVPSNKHAN